MLFKRLFLLYSVSGYSLVDATDHTLKSFARTTFCEVVCSVSDHVLYTLCPAYRACELCDEVLLDVGRVSMRLAVNVLVYRTLRSVDFGLLDSCFKLILGWLHEWRVESTTHLQR